MKNYIEKNLEPILIGFTIAYIFCKIIDFMDDVIVKIALIYAK